MKNKKKISFVINYFYPDLASTAQIMTELTSEIQNDFDITVIAAQPGYAGERKSVKKIFEKDCLDSMKVIRIKLPEVDKNSKLSRVRYIVSYFVLANIALLKERKTDIIYTISQPPILGGLIGSIGKFLKGSKHVYNIHDFNPEQAAAVSYTNNQLVFKIAKFIDNINCRYADHIVMVGQDMGETLAKRFKGRNVPAYSVVNNWTDEDEILPLGKEHPVVADFLQQNGLQDKFIVAYSGNIGLYYDLENIIRIAKDFTNIPDLVFLFIGEGAVKHRMQEYVEEHNLSNVVFLPYQPKDFIRYSLNAADIHLVVNQKGIKGVSVPSKIYGVMAAGKPVLGVLEQGSEAERLITESQSGIVVEPHDYESISEAVRFFYDMSAGELNEMGMRGRIYLENHLTKETSINKSRTLLLSI
ncbi:glycosyltransferase family 4 protein [Planococcus salinus]|uniref:Glycosyltransferase WbuB n=1 Tax=Planococcus salinus TaxID=1848460 RepID=A0A3M8P8J2_9BACL|nr:glycosyltransferase family 4 protein [Planococcus salinus]RNF39514.1 glycosyltransferase WbuB [Planococcus salinus]